MPKFELTNGQRQLCDEIVDWYTHCFDEDYVYCGAAGTGKTSIVPEIISRLGLSSEEVLYVAYTGKAASVLMQKGFNASTIHSAFYELKEFPVIKNGEYVKKNGRLLKTLKFVEKEFINSNIKLIFIDEWSMVSDEFAKCIYKFGIPVIAAGDKYQLPPIFGKSPFEDKIKFELTEITRQNKYSGIVTLATLIRNGEELPVHFHNYFNDAYIMSKDLLTDKHLLKADIILTVKNKTRNIFNRRVRFLHGSNGKLPMVGDKLINRKNCWSMKLNGIPLVNGILGKCVNPIRLDECQLNRGIYRMDFQPDYVIGDEFYEAIPCDYYYLNEDCGNNKEADQFNPGHKFEYAEAITVHLSQGSQYDNVIYWDDFVGDRDYMRQLRYTAITRAVKKVIMFI